MADMAARVALNYLLDFYGPLLTPHRQELMRLYCEEDLSQQEIAEQLDITRQGVFDAIAKSKRQLMEYERKLGLVARYQAQAEAAKDCLAALDRLHPGADDRRALAQARQALERIITDK
ncbi:MAG: DNA-binding protein [Clostridia bacterium]|nr:DNA-binding protein [Clostridia bacterium]